MVKFNENNETINEEAYNAILVGLQIKQDITRSMEELEGLAEAAGVNVLGQMIQSLERPNTATFIGKGKVQELAELCANMEVDTVIFDSELSGMQLRNLEDILGVRVIDRTILILDIFAKRATSKEGKLQVELAQLKYRLPRLTGFGKSLSRLGGGIGTRGPGEKKLETDRRHIESRMEDIKSELLRARRTRQVQRAGREKGATPIVALMGYTNSGKSALMNRLLAMSDKDDKQVMERDMLFATLDTSHREISLQTGDEFILIDTVGFVSKLPHSLVEAFKSTLEEVQYADLLLHVVDSAYEDKDFQIEVTNKVIKEIGAADKEKVMVYNKIDLADELPIDATGSEYVCVSAKTGKNMDELVEMIKSKIFGDRVNTVMLIPYSRGDITSYLCENARIEEMKYENEGTVLKGSFDKKDYMKYQEYVREDL